jgi:hypothetical protein
MAPLVRAVETDMVAETAINDLRRRGASLTGRGSRRRSTRFSRHSIACIPCQRPSGLERTPRNIPDLTSYLAAVDGEGGE